MMIEAWAICLAAVMAGNLYAEEPGVREFSGQMIVRPVEALRGESIDLRERRAAESALRPYLVRYVPATDEFIVRVPSGKSENGFSAELMATGRFSYAEPDWRVFPAATPNDPKWVPTTTPAYPGQWYHNTLNTNYAFNFLSAGSLVTVAVVDTGVDASHPDLAGVCLPGRNVVPGTPDVNDTSDASTFGHGTFAAGIIAANPHNGLDICGMGWNGVGAGMSGNLFRLLPVRVSNTSGGTALISTINDGIRWAAESGAKVINTSYSGFDTSTVGITGTYVRGLGAFSVWAAGNDGINKSNPAYDHKDVLIVGGTDINDQRWVNSNFGLCVDFFAPATQVTSLKKGSGTKTPIGGGTSFAAPMVSGILAQIISRTPSLSWVDVEKRLKYGCRDMMDNNTPGLSGYLPGNDWKYGWGRVHSAKSLIWPHDLASFPMQYQITLLPVPSGRIASSVLSINDQGSMVGSSGVNASSWEATYWHAVAPYTPQLLGIQSGMTGSEARQINDLGIAVVQSWAGTYPNNSDRISTWTLQGGLVDFPSNWYDPYPNGGAFKINNHGTMAGLVYSAGNTVGEAATWDSNGIFRLGPQTGFVNSYAFAVNNNNITVGKENLNGDGFWWDGISVTWFQNVDGGGSEAWSINDQNQAVGTAGNPPRRAMLIDKSDSIVKKYTLTPGSTFDWALSINEWEQVVGFSLISGQETAMIFDGPVTGPLQSMCTIAPFTRLARIYDINNNGEIVGYGMFGGNPRGFLAKPLADANLEFAYNMGQEELAESGGPVYLGAIPPALRVQFRTETGDEFAGNPSILAPYNRTTGRILLETLPPEIDAPFRVYVKVDDLVPGHLGPGYLGQLTPPMSQPPFALDIRSAELVNLVQGDCDMDNEIGIGDYAILSSYYGTENGDGTYVGYADVNGDDAVDIADYAILSANYGLVGD